MVKDIDVWLMINLVWYVNKTKGVPNTYKIHYFLGPEKIVVLEMNLDKYLFRFTPKTMVFLMEGVDFFATKEELYYIIAEYINMLILDYTNIQKLIYS
jgi:hypothetical protein